MTLLVQAPGLPGGYSARVDGGDLVTFTVRSRMFTHLSTSVVNAGAPNISVLAHYYRQDGTTIVGGGNYYQTLENVTWNDYTYQSTAPSGAYFVRAMAGFIAGTPSGYSLNYDPSVLVDSGVLSVE